MQGQPFIPKNITVHLGAPDSKAENITISFPDYIKNVASSEIYPTWPENALRANIYAIISFALNRVYTEWYRSKGYNFDITNSTQYDQKYKEGGEVFKSISEIVDEIFNDYVQKQGRIEPYFTQFCNGTTVTCKGLSQWGTVSLANKGMTPYEILQYYYGNDINIVKDAPVRINTPSYPGTELKKGDNNKYVELIQIQLNRISKDYPAINKIYPLDGIFGPNTESAVKKFQQIFNLPMTGIVDKATWYKISYIYNAVKKLGELESEGVEYSDITFSYLGSVQPGDKGLQIELLQYFLNFFSLFNNQIPPVEKTGVFDNQTENAVKAFQRLYGLTPDGIVGPSTKIALENTYYGIIKTIESETGESFIYPGNPLVRGSQGEDVKLIQKYLSYISDTYPSISKVPETGYYGDKTYNAVKDFQKQFDLVNDGVVGPITWGTIVSLYTDLKYGYSKNRGQFYIDLGKGM